MKHQFFVTGANGFIGQHLVEYLAEQKYEVFCLLRPGTLPGFTMNAHTHVRYGDLRDKRSLLQTIPKNSHVINLAANPYHKTLSYDVNVQGTRNLLDAAERRNVRRMIHISTQATKISKKGVYATTKQQSDELVRNSHIPYVILKPSLVYGSGEKGLFSKIAKLASKLPFIPVFGDGEVKLYPIHVWDLCVLIEKTADDTRLKNKTFDAGGKTPITYNDLYAAISQYLPKKPALVHIPKTLGLVLAKVFSILPHPPIYEDNVLGSTQETNCDPLPLLKRYSYQPRSFIQGIQSVFAPKKIRVGIVGLGKMGMLHATILQTIPEAEIVALIDTNPRLSSTIKSMGVSGRSFPSLSDAVKHTPIDAVYITTPTFAHLPLLKEAIKHHLHIFIEKPVSLNLKEQKELARLRSQAVVRTGYTLLYHRPFQELANIFAKKQYGKLLSYTATFEHGEVFGSKQGWMFSKKLSGGGVLMNPGPHLFSLISMYVGVPKKIEGKGERIYSTEVEDRANYTFMHANFSGKVSLSWSIPKKDVAEYTFACRFQRANITATQTAIIIRPKQGKTITLRFNDLHQEISSTFTINPSAYGEAYYLENLNFIQSIIQDKKSINSLQAALQTENIIMMCYKQGVL